MSELVRAFYLSVYSGIGAIQQKIISKTNLMKRILLTAASILCLAVSARAQGNENPGHIFGIRAGVNFSRTFNTEMFEDFEHEFGTGFHVGGSYDIALSKSRKWYFQTGLNLKYHTARARELDEGRFDMNHEFGTYNIYENKYKALYLEVPAMFARKIRITDDWGIRPAIGLSYAVGLWGEGDERNARYEDDVLVANTHTTLDLFNQDVLDNGAAWERHSINGRFAVDVIYKHYLLGADVFYGLKGDMWGISISVGYNF